MFKTAERMEKIVFFIVAIVLTLMLAQSCNFTHTIYAPEREAVILTTGEIFDLVVLDHKYFFTKHNVNRRKYSKVLCQRKFEIGLFSTTEVYPKCGAPTN